MRSESEVPVHHLIVDASGFIKNAPVIDIGAQIYTVPEVRREIRDKATRERLQDLPYELKLQEPTSDSMNIVKEISKKTGDYAALSVPDLKLLALVHDLHVKFIGKDSVNYDVKNVVEIASSALEAKQEEAKVPFGFIMPAAKTNQDVEMKEDSEEDDEGWVTEDNLVSVLDDHGAAEKVSEKLPVALLSSDFAVQNVAKHMKLNLISVDGLIIKTLKSYILRCRSCYKTTTDMTKRFCPKCGNDSLHRVAVTVNEDGTLRLHIDWQKLSIKRGLNKPKKEIKGGKHDDCDQFFEDQRLPHNRPAKVLDDPISESPFTKHDVSSRAAILGIRNRNSNKRKR